MSDKLKFIRVIAFAADTVRFDPHTNPENSTRQREILLPVDAISHLTPKEPGNPRTTYQIHLKSNYPFGDLFQVKSFNTPSLSLEQVEVIAGSKM